MLSQLTPVMDSGVRIKGTRLPVVYATFGYYYRSFCRYYYYYMANKTAITDLICIKRYIPMAGAHAFMTIKPS